MDYKNQYKEKLTTAQEAVKCVKSGDWVDYGWCTGTADLLDRALADRYEELTDVKVRGGILFKKPAIMQVPDTCLLYTSKNRVNAHPPFCNDGSSPEPEFVCSEKHRAFFKEQIGNGFSFNVAFQKWLKNHPGKTYKEAITAYYQILEDKKKGKTKIDKQFEYNTYIRDFFANHPGKSLEDAIKCWKMCIRDSINSTRHEPPHGSLGQA